MKKMPAPKPKTVSLKPRSALHLQRREADVDAVDPGDDVEQQQERQQAPADFRERRAAEVGLRIGGGLHCVLKGRAS